ncbi:hypothetical protein KP509_01G003900 [Ceratopteris richardii]|uniref:Uncharacterized protein n=1 Tax=Ceratopteris richardii TaxID=49495 RepID=A0A8T2VLL8_CERRI|nr:hypothetical protein KP509_01G003900 [Ceratopteris richardii]
MESGLLMISLASLMDDSIDALALASRLLSDFAMLDAIPCTPGTTVSLLFTVILGSFFPRVASALPHRRICFNSAHAPDKEIPAGLARVMLA